MQVTVLFFLWSHDRQASAIPDIGITVQLPTQISLYEVFDVRPGSPTTFPAANLGRNYVKVTDPVDMLFVRSTPWIKMADAL